MPNLGPVELVILLFFGVLLVWPWWRIFSKAGYPGWYALSQLLPLVNVLALFFLAFSKWPIRASTD
jgi:uncharacterized membrane protein YhaH (DUF805 family)